MRLTELLPLLKELSHSDKLLLLHWLTSELLQESSLVPLNTQDRLANQGLCALSAFPYLPLTLI